MERLPTGDPFTMVFRDSLHHLHVFRLHPVSPTVDLRTFREQLETKLTKREGIQRFQLRTIPPSRQKLFP